MPKISVLSAFIITISVHQCSKLESLWMFITLWMKDHENDHCQRLYVAALKPPRNDTEDHVASHPF